LEAGRVLSAFREEMDRNVRIVLFSSEEFGCWGSKDYAKRHADEMKNMRFTYQLDCTAGGNTQLVTLANWPELVPLYKKLAADLKMNIPVEQRSGPGDSRAFNELGIPNGSIIDYRAPGRLSLLKTWRHTMYDTLDKIDLRSMREAITIGAVSTLRMVNSEEWPSQRKQR
jgi:Zn-dependent M28 family amino/carboxypeptidase